MALVVVLSLYLMCLSEAISTVPNVDEIVSQNKQLIAALERMEKKIADLEERVSGCRTTDRRQTYEGPVAFTYKLAPRATNVQKNSVISFPSRVTDLGGGFDNSTGVFIAPQDGLYMFSCSLLADSHTGSNPMLHASIVVDGMAQANVFAYSETDRHRDQGANTIFVNLKKGSRVWVKAIDSTQVTIGGHEYSTFSGYLLWQF